MCSSSREEDDWQGQWFKSIAWNDISLWLLSWRILDRGGIEDRSQQSKMVRSLSSLAIFMLLGAAVIALPPFAPKVQADELVALAKGDRLEIRAAFPDCSAQVWPDFPTSCLRHAGSGTKIQEARLVTARR